MLTEPQGKEMKYLTQVTDVKIKPPFRFLRVKMDCMISSEILKASQKINLKGFFSCNSFLLDIF